MGEHANKKIKRTNERYICFSFDLINGSSAIAHSIEFDSNQVIDLLEIAIETIKKEETNGRVEF